MAYGYRNRRSSRGRGRLTGSLARRQGGTGATFSGTQNIIRHSHSRGFTLESGKAVCYPLVAYNPSKHGTPAVLDGSSTKVLTNDYTTDGSRVDYVTVQMTMTQEDTSKNNTCYVGTISTSFNEGRLSDTLMQTNFNDFIEEDGTAGAMDASTTAQDYSINEYSLKDIHQHNIRNLLTPQFQLYSGRVVTANQTIPLPFKNRRQQEGSFYGLLFLNDSEYTASSGVGSDVNIRLDSFFKEIPSNEV